MEDQLREIEQKDGIRLPFNVLPTKPSETLPTAILYTPRQPGPARLSYEPVFCSCRAILNPFSTLDFTRKTYTCTFCNRINSLPEHYRDIAEDTLPLELYDSTVEYVSNNAYNNFMYVFVVDVCTFDDERHTLMQEAVKLAYDLLPDDALVCFVLFGTNVELIEDVGRTYLFSGKKAYKTEDLHRLLGINKNYNKNINATSMNMSKESINNMHNISSINNMNISSINKSKNNLSSGENINKTESLVSRFFVRKSDCKLDIKNILKKDPFPVLSGKRPLRCTGAALSLASSLLDVADTAGKVLLFTQGACAFGPGSIASLSLTEGIRSHSDIIRGKANYVKPSMQFYTEIANTLAGKGHALDIIAATIEDVGVFEMRVLVDMTGGIIVMAQDFCKETYMTSIKKNFRKECDQCINYKNSDDENNKGINENGEGNEQEDTADLNSKSICENCREKAAFVMNGKIRVVTSSNISFYGILGQGSSFAHGWRIGCIYPHTNLSILFEPVGARAEDLAYVQIISQAQEGIKLITRVTTLARMFNDTTEKISMGFDQEAACVLQARMYTAINSFEDDLDLVRRIDRGLIRFVKRFASFSRDDPGSVLLPESMQFYPNFMYFLRRSVVVQSAYNSADETSYYRSILNGQRITEAMTIVVPTLTSFNYSEGTGPVEMDMKSLRPDFILLLDAFVKVVIWHGEHVAEWIKQGLHEKEEYEAFKLCIEESRKQAREIISKRLLTPYFVETKAGGSQERILMGRVNPSMQGTEVMTDDIDFESFYRCLCKIIVEA